MASRRQNRHKHVSGVQDPSLTVSRGPMPTVSVTALAAATRRPSSPRIAHRKRVAVSQRHNVASSPQASWIVWRFQPICPTGPRRSGESLPGADCLQSVSGNSRVLDTLDTKLRVEAYYQSGSLPPAVEQLESGARNSQLLHLDVQLEAVPGSSVTTWSIPGVCCTSPHSPATPSHSTRPSLADGCS